MYYPEQIDNPEMVTLNFNGKQKDCVRVRIHGGEYRSCDDASRRFWSSGKRGSFGKGLLNTNADPYKTERIGLLGQMAFAKLTEETVDLEYRHGGDEQDNLILGLKFDIKCASRNYGKNLIQKTNEFGKPQKINKDVYVGSFVESENTELGIADIILVGFCSQKDVLEAETAIGIRGNGHVNYVIPFEKMKSIVEMISIIKRNKAKKGTSFETPSYRV